MVPANTKGFLLTTRVPADYEGFLLTRKKGSCGLNRVPARVQVHKLLLTPLLDRTVAKRRYITPKLFIVISFFFFPLIDNLIKFCYKQRMSHQLKNLSLLLTINEYCMFHIEAFFSPTTFSSLYFIVVISTQIELNCWAWSRIQENLM